MAVNNSARCIPTGLYPFWFWNGDLSADEIRWQVGEMAAKGVRGFFMHPRQGLKQPYLSEAFFRMVETAVEAAEKHELVVHLYDEYPYPSGVAGGEVILGNPRFHATQLVQQTFDVPGGPVRIGLPRGKVLNCVAHPLNNGQPDWTRGIDLREQVGMVLPDESYMETGLTRYNRKRYFAGNPTPTLEAELADGPHRIFVSVQALVADHKYWGHFVDVLNADAIHEFVKLTHERYYARFGEQFGTRIHSIFVDETTPKWSERIPEAFGAQYGYDLLPFLPALQDASHPDHLKVAHDLHRLKYKLFCRTFEEPIARWCDEHGLRYSGEKPSLRLSQLRHMHIPGCEPGHTKAGAKMDLLRPNIRQNARATASAAYFYGKEGALCECCHSLGWSGTLQDAKLIAEGLLLMGIRYLVPHGFFYTTHALAKHDAPPTFFFQMPYWPFFGHLSGRIERIAEHFEGTHMDARILVVEPSSGLPTSADLQAYGDLLDLLMGEHLDFLVVDTDILESGRVEEGGVRIRDVSARVVIVPRMRVVEEPLQAWLDAFEKAGGSVIRCEPAFDRDELAGRLLAIEPPRLRLSAKDGSTRNVHVVTRAGAGRTLWFVLNTRDETLEVTFDAGCRLREIPLDDALPQMLVETDAGYARTLQPFESILLQAADEGEAPPVRLPRSVRIPVRGPAKVTPLNKNLLRMHDWRMELLDENGSVLQGATVPAAPLVNQLEKGGFRFAPAIDYSFGRMPQLRLPALRVRYGFSFDNHYAGPVELVMEPGSIVGEWRIRVNDGDRIKPSDFRPTDAHVRGSLGVDVTRFLRQGENRIIAEVGTDRPDGGLLNPLYLAGDFGVELDPLRLVQRPETGGFEAWEANGLPYYAGVVEYETTFELDNPPAGDAVLAELDYEVAFQDAAEVSFNRGALRPVLWSPRRLLVPVAELKKGRNVLRTRVHTTLIRSFEGQWFDIAQHRYGEVGGAGAR